MNIGLLRNWIIISADRKQVIIRLNCVYLRDNVKNDQKVCQCTQIQYEPQADYVTRRTSYFQAATQLMWLKKGQHHGLASAGKLFIPKLIFSPYQCFKYSPARAHPRHVIYACFSRLNAHILFQCRTQHVQKCLDYMKSKKKSTFKAH